MFTKEDLSGMKYKELICLAKQYGVYKSRSKKVYLLDKLLSLLSDELVMKEASSIQESIMNATEVEAFNEEKLSAELTPLRRETFEIDPRTKSDIFKAAEKHCTTNDKEKSIMNATEVEAFNEEKLSAELTPLRRETFEIDPRTKSDIFKAAEKHCTTNDKENDLEKNLPSNRRETYSIEKEENSPYTGNERTSICRQKTSSVNKPKDNLASDKISRTSVLRQNTFSIDKPGKYHKLEEMPGVICQEFKCTPTIKPYIVKETPPRSVRFRSGVVTRNSLPSSVGPSRSIGQRIENQRSTKIEKRPSSRGFKQQKNLSLNMVSVTPSRIHKTSLKGGKIEKKITPSKLPNFKAIHMREFSKMESIVEHTNRKAERTKSLLTPIKFNHKIPTSNVKKTAKSHIPLKFDLKVNVAGAKLASVNPSKPENKTHNKNKQSILPNPKLNLSLRKSGDSNIKEKLKFLDSPMTKVRRKSASPVKDITNKIVCNPKKRFENIKEIVTTKMHPFSVERNRVRGRNFLQSVRMNRRFQLQMEVMRKAKV